MNSGTTEKCDVIQQLTRRTGARTRYQLSNLLDLTVSIPVSYTHLTLPTNREV